MKKMNMRLLVIVLAGAISTAIGQVDQNEPFNLPLNAPIPPAPEAAALGEYGNVPISYYSGRANASIPIWQFDGKETGLSVSLSHGGGARKVEEMATWVGLGWSLNAGGVITRTVNGLADDANRGTNFNYFQSAELVEKFIEAPDDFDNNGESLLTRYQFQSDVVDLEKYDTQPDYYFYNFGGFSGRIFIHPDGLVAYSDEAKGLKIEHNYSVGAPITRWTITTPDGTLYVFDSTEETEYQPDDEVPGSQYTRHISSWYLTQIISANGYDQVSFEYHEYNLQEIDQNPRKNIQQSVVFDNGTCITSTNIGTPPITRQSNLYPKRITFNNLGSIDFLISPSDRLDLPGRPILEEIIVYNDVAIPIRSFQVQTSYFSSGSTSQEKRLRLDDLQEHGLDNSGNIVESKPPHRFEYAGNPPSTYSFAQDKWGFHNGANGNTELTFFPPLGEDEGVNCPNALPFGNREPSEGSVTAGALTKITYPTGGETEFELGLNTLETNEVRPKEKVISIGLNGSRNVESGGQELCFTNEVGFCPNCDEGDIPNVEYLEFRIPNNATSISASLTFTTSVDLSSPVQTVEEDFSFAAIIDLDVHDYSNSCMRQQDPTPFRAMSDFASSSMTQFPAIDQVALANDKRYALVLASNIPEHYVSLNVTYNVPELQPVFEKLGDIRINKIIDRSVGHPDVERTISYEGATLYANPKFLEIRNNTSVCQDEPESRSLTRYSSSLAPLGAVQGAIVGYSRVTETFSDGGQNIYHYETSANTVNSSYPYAPASVNAPLAGKLLRQTSNARQSDGTYQKVREVQNTYQNPSITSIKGLKIAKGNSYPIQIGYYDGTTTYLQPNGQPVDNAPSGIAQAGWYKSQSCSFQTTLPFCEVVQFRETVNEVPAGGFFQFADCIEETTSNIESFPSDYVSAQYSINAKFPYLEQTIVTDYTQGNETEFRQVTTDYFYENSEHYQLTKQVVTTTGDLKPTATVYKYAPDYAGSPHPTINVLNSRNMIGIPIETQLYYGDGFVNAQVTDYNTSGRALPRERYLLNTARPLSKTDNTVNNYTSFLHNPNFVSEENVVYDLSIGRPILIEAVDGVPRSFHWDATGYYLLAEALNAAPDEVYFTSFEEDAGATLATSFTGDWSRSVSGSYNVNLGSGKSGDYVLSYWHQTSLGAQWQLVVEEYPEFSGSSVTINASGHIDEIKFHPRDAQVTSYTHRRLIGLTSRSTPNNLVEHFQYDALGRLQQRKDQDGYVLQEYEYNYKNQ